MRQLHILLLAAAVAVPVAAQRGQGRLREEAGNLTATAPAGAPQTPLPAAPPAKVEDKTSRTQHSVTIGGQQLKYTATAGTMVLKKEDGTPTASLFYIAYVKDDVADPSKRPLAFAFNGGPGSSSVWLHMGTLGP